MLLAVVLTSLLATPSALFVEVSSAKLRAAPVRDAKVVGRVPIGAPLKVNDTVPGFYEVELLSGATGFIAKTAVGSTRPQLDALLKRKKITRAVALAPGDLDVIARFEKTLKPARAYYARKGWVAAKRRALSWDGPLYPIVNGRALLPATCGSHEDKPTGPHGMDLDRRLKKRTVHERRRAFRWVSSGKVVSVSERGYTTEHLGKPACLDEQLAYTTRGARGALVPSWMVAGFDVVPFERTDDGYRARTVRGVVEVEVDDAFLKVRIADFDSAVGNELEAKGATPIAVFAERMDVFFVLTLERGRACGGSSDVQARLYRARVVHDEDRRFLELTPGRPWAANFVEGCAQTAATRPLDGEPRDVSKAALMKAGWMK